MYFVHKIRMATLRLTCSQPLKLSPSVRNLLLTSMLASVLARPIISLIRLATSGMPMIQWFEPGPVTFDTIDPFWSQIITVECVAPLKMNGKKKTKKLKRLAEIEATNKLWRRLFFICCCARSPVPINCCVTSEWSETHYISRRNTFAQQIKEKTFIIPHENETKRIEEMVIQSVRGRWPIRDTIADAKWLIWTGEMNKARIITQVLNAQPVPDSHRSCGDTIHSATNFRLTTIGDYYFHWPYDSNRNYPWTLALSPLVSRTTLNWVI